MCMRCVDTVTPKLRLQTVCVLVCAQTYLVASWNDSMAASKLCTGHCAHQGIWFASGLCGGCLIQNVCHF